MDIGLATAGTLSPGARRVARVAWREAAPFGLLACGLSWLWWGWWLYPHLGRLLGATATPADVASGGSVLVAAVLHASLNTYADTPIGTRIPQANPLLVYPLMGLALLGSASIVYFSGERSPVAPGSVGLARP